MTRLEVNLEPAELAIVKEILGRFIPDREVRAFGSRVKGRTKKFSDLDLAIMGEEKIAPQTMAELREAFTESDLPFKVDLLDWAATAADFRSRIEAHTCTLTATAAAPQS